MFHAELSGAANNKAKSNMNRDQKNHLRDIANTAYEREMNNAMEILFASFNKWKKGQLYVHDLDQAIHRHHNGISRDLFKLYTMIDPRFSVSLAVKKRVIKIEEIREDCRSLIIDLPDINAD
jgi:hypothetical protein